MVMAWWRGAPYASRMRFFRDSDAETPVQWKLARKGAKDFPLYHLFHLSVLEDRPTGPRWPVGEVVGSVRPQKVWRRSTLPGVCFTGTPEQWATGCLLSDPVPAKEPCCLPPWVLPVPIVIGFDFLWGTVVTLLVEQYDGTHQVPTTTILDFDQATRLLVESLGPGHAGVRWLGLRGYHAGDGYFGPEPDVEFRDGGGLTWVVSHDAVNKRVVVGVATCGCPPTGPAGGALTGTYPDPTIGTVTSGLIDGGTTDQPGGQREGGPVPQLSAGGEREGGPVPAAAPAVLVSCCPDPVRVHLFLHVTGGGLDGVYPLDYDPVLGAWVYSGAFGSCPPADASVRLFCSGGLWSLYPGTAAFAYGTAMAVCDSLRLTFTGMSSPCQPVPDPMSGDPPPGPFDAVVDENP